MPLLRHRPKHRSIFQRIRCPIALRVAARWRALRDRNVGVVAIVRNDLPILARPEVELECLLTETIIRRDTPGSAGSIEKRDNPEVPGLGFEAR
jgi:hypothetical protein